MIMGAGKTPSNCVTESLVCLDFPRSVISGCLGVLACALETRVLAMVSQRRFH